MRDGQGSLPTLPYHRTSMGTNALKRLGERIAASVELTAEEQDLYQLFIVDANRRGLVAQALVNISLKSIANTMPNADVVATGRTKTLRTLREKLQRTPQEKLPSIRDVAGVRIVADMSLLEQRLLVTALSETLTHSELPSVGFTGENRVIDRTAEPANGYRAIHVVIRLDGQPVEIQVRTELQHGWAALMELACDRWGRGPRYGEPIDETDPELRTLKIAFFDRLALESDNIRELEDQLSSYGMADIEVPQGVDPIVDQAQVVVRSRLRKRARRAIAGMKQDVRDSLTRLGEIMNLIDEAGAERMQR